jgi:hypothetical protein
MSTAWCGPGEVVTGVLELSGDSGEVDEMCLVEGSPVALSASSIASSCRVETWLESSLRW